MAHNCCYDKFLMKFIWGREDGDKKDKREVKLDFFFRLKTALFEHMF
jgi:hypothetical protein